MHTPMDSIYSTAHCTKALSAFVPLLLHLLEMTPLLYIFRSCCFLALLTFPCILALSLALLSLLFLPFILTSNLTSPLLFFPFLVVSCHCSPWWNEMKHICGIHPWTHEKMWRLWKCWLHLAMSKASFVCVCVYLSAEQRNNDWFISNPLIVSAACFSLMWLWVGEGEKDWEGEQQCTSVRQINKQKEY